MEQDTEAREIPQEPLSKENTETEKPNAELLTHEELVEQTRAFMQKFQKQSKSGELPDTIFFLDKKARPLAYMFRKLFPTYCPDAKTPAIRYINIGREQTHDYYDDTTKDRHFTGDPAIIASTYGKYIDTKGRIMIVDEYVDSGKTINNATSMISQAFPDAEISAQTAYTKRHKWGVLGIEEYTIDDYMHKALELVNEEQGTDYKSPYELLYKSAENGGTDKNLLLATRDKIEGTIPYTKRSNLSKPISISQKIKALAGKVVGMRQQEEINTLRQARKALDTVCAEVIASSSGQEHA